jgi:dihydrofolate synthase/folylpolyglutamate synthase
LYTSPYLQAATEKVQVDNALMSGKEFSELVDQILACTSSHPDFRFEPISYAETWVALALLYFAQRSADIAVVETGAGGRFDMTNVVEPIVSVITSVGIDHVETLGGSIESIAWHKAGIIKPGTPIVSGVVDPAAIAVIVQEAEHCKSPLVAVDATAPEHSPAGLHQPHLPGFARSNHLLALRALELLQELGFSTSTEARRSGLAQGRLPGRFETVTSRPMTLLDGAHNEQKVAALAQAIPTVFSGVTGRRVLVFGALESKQALEMASRLLPHVSAVVLTEPNVYRKAAASAEILKAALTVADTRRAFAVEPEPAAAFAVASDLAGADGAVLVTGSLYLVGNVRERWYPTPRIVSQRTPWPTLH